MKNSIMIKTPRLKLIGNIFPRLRASSFVLPVVPKSFSGNRWHFTEGKNPYNTASLQHPKTLNSMGNDLLAQQ